VLLLLFACENTDEEINALSKKVSMTDRALKVESYLSQGGKVKAKLTAPLMLRVQADTVYTEFPKTLHVDFYNDSAKIESKLDSKYGKYMESISMIYLRDSVRVVSVKGDTLYCQDLWWDQNKQLFYTNKPARYHSSDKRLQGDLGLQATQDLKNVTFIQTHGQTSPGQTGLPGQPGAAAPADTSSDKNTTGQTGSSGKTGASGKTGSPTPTPAAPPPAK